MKERVKVFTHISGHGTSVLQPPLENYVNEWLSTTGGKLVNVTQPESDRPGVGHHITVCLWYTPGEETNQRLE
jgi:hypothetical protein